LKRTVPAVNTNQLGLSPAQAGFLRMVAAAPGRSQKELAEDLVGNVHLAVARVARLRLNHVR